MRRASNRAAGTILRPREVRCRILRLPRACARSLHRFRSPIQPAIARPYLVRSVAPAVMYWPIRASVGGHWRLGPPARQAEDRKSGCDAFDIPPLRVDSQGQSQVGNSLLTKRLQMFCRRATYLTDDAQGPVNRERFSEPALNARGGLCRKRQVEYLTAMAGAR